MRNLVVSVAAAIAALSVGPALAEPPLVGIVSIAATEANNARYISGAQAAAKEARLERVGRSTPPAARIRPTPRSRISRNAAP